MSNRRFINLPGGPDVIVVVAPCDAEGATAATDAAVERINGVFAELARVTAERDRLKACVNSLYLRRIFGLIEDTDSPLTNHLWTYAQAWIAFRDEALAPFRKDAAGE